MVHLIKSVVGNLVRLFRLVNCWLCIYSCYFQGLIKLRCIGFLSSEDFTLSIWIKGTDTGVSSDPVEKSLIGWANVNVCMLNSLVLVMQSIHTIIVLGFITISNTTNISDNNCSILATFVNTRNLGYLYIDGALK